MSEHLTATSSDGRAPRGLPLICAGLLVLAAALAACGPPAPMPRIERLATVSQTPRPDGPPPSGRLTMPPSVTARDGVIPPVDDRPTPPAPARVAPPDRVATAVPAPPPAARDDIGMEDSLREILGTQSEQVSVVARRLNDGATVRWNADRVHYAASLYKLEVLYEAYRQRRLGALDFDRRLTLQGRYVDEDLGTAGRLPLDADGSLSVEDAVRAMVTYSDNSSAALLLDLLGHRNIDTTMAALGLTASSVNSTELPTTAADMARIMEVIARGEGLDLSSAAQMTALLLLQENRWGIPRGVPAGVPVGNKWGGWNGSLHDVAVVTAPGGTYVLAVLTEGVGNWDLITRVSRAVYNHWNAPTAR